MRILGYIEHPVFKITVFKTDTRLSIKFENGDFEQTYKLRPTEHIKSIPAINRLLDTVFLEKVQLRFTAMKEDLSTSFQRNVQLPEEDEFPEII